MEAAGQTPSYRRRERPDAVLAAKTRSGGKSVPPPPLSLQKPGRKLRTREDVSEDRDQRQVPPCQRIRTRSRAPSTSCRSCEFQVRLPPPPFRLASILPSASRRLAHGKPPSGTNALSDSVYIGSTTDLESRVLKHNDGSASRFTATRRPVRLVYSEPHATCDGALKRERQLKRWTRKKRRR